MIWKKPHSRSRSHSPTFDTWHGTDQAFEVEEINPAMCELGFHSGSKEQAEEFAIGDDSRMIPLQIELKNPMRLIDKASWNPNKTWNQAVELGYVTDPGHRFEKKLEHAGLKYGAAMLRQRFQLMGYDGIVYLNRYEGIPKDEMHKINQLESDSNYHMTDAEILEIAPMAHDSYIAFEPCQIKRRQVV